MKTYTFTSNTVTVGEKTFPAEYSITPSGSVIVFVDIGAPERVKVRFQPDHEEYDAARAAAMDAQTPTEERPETISTAADPAPVERPAEEEQPAADPAPVEQPAEERPETISAAADPAPAQQEERDPKQARGPIPEKSFIGTSIDGNGWTILFDGVNMRTRVCFENQPAPAVRAAVERAGFYYSPTLNSFNKKLTFKAYRAAQALSAELSTMCA